MLETASPVSSDTIRYHRALRQAAFKFRELSVQARRSAREVWDIVDALEEKYPQLAESKEDRASNENS